MLNILPKVSSLPSLLDKKPCESGYIEFSNSHVISRLSRDQSDMFGKPNMSAACLVWFHIPSEGRVMSHICHLSPQGHFIKVPCVFMGESSAQYVTTLKSLVIIGILIVKRKNASSKT